MLLSSLSLFLSLSLSLSLSQGNYELYEEADVWTAIQQVVSETFFHIDSTHLLASTTVGNIFISR